MVLNAARTSVRARFAVTGMRLPPKGTRRPLARTQLVVLLHRPVPNGRTCADFVSEASPLPVHGSGGDSPPHQPHARSSGRTHILLDTVQTLGLCDDNRSFGG